MKESFLAKHFDSEKLARLYQQEGFAVLKGVFSRDQVQELQQETLNICQGERGPLIGMKATESATALDSVLAIHFPHKVSEVMRATLFQADIVRALTAIIGPNIKCMQSMLFVKNAGKPGQAWHQDEHFIPTRDKSLTGIWIALDDARVDNGCLWMHPGSHQAGVLWPTHAHHDNRFDGSEEAYGFPDDREGGVPVEADAGDVVLFNGYVLHRSLNNTRTNGYRRALVNHVMSAKSLLPWSIGFPATLREDYRDIEIISGQDPYAWKGIDDIMFPFIRPEDAKHAALINKEVREEYARRVELSWDNS